MKKFSLVLLLSVLSVVFCFQNHAGAGQVINIRVIEFPPLHYKDSSGNWAGLEVELSAAIVKAAGYEPVFQDLPWARALRMMEDGENLYMTNLAKTEERSAFVNWIGPVRNSGMVLIVKKGDENLPISNLDDFITVSRKEKKRFGYQIGVAYSEEFDKRIKNDPEFKNCFEEIARGELNFRKVSGDRIIGFFENRISVAYQIKNNPDYNGLAIHPFVVGRNAAYHGVSKKGIDEETLKKLREAFDKLQKDGSLQRIIDKYDK